MPVQESLYGIGSGELASVRNQKTVSAELRARELLGGDGDLTYEQYHDLDRVFRALSQPELAALIDDPRNQVRLRQYEALSWRRHGASVVVPALLLLTGVALSFALLAG